MRGYKAFNPDMTCMGFQYEEGKEYVHNGDIKLCESGFHFCTNASDCFSYYDFDPENIVCRVESLGITKTNEVNSKVVTDHIKIGKKLEWSEVLELVNTGRENTGFCNSGRRNSGHRNSGFFLRW